MACLTLPPELWAHIVSYLADWHSPITLSKVSFVLNGVVSRTRWSGIREMRLASHSRAFLEDRVSGRLLPTRVLGPLVLAHCSDIDHLTLGIPAAPGHERVQRHNDPANYQLALREIVSVPWIQRPSLTSLTLNEIFAACPEAPSLVAAFAPFLINLSISGCETMGPKDPSRLWTAISRCNSLQSLFYGFCKGESSNARLVEAGLSNKTDLVSLTLRGLTRLTPSGLLQALNSIKAKNLQRLALESIPYTNEVFMEASLGSDEARVSFSRLHSFRMAKCGFIFAPLVLSVMPSLRNLQVSLSEMSEVVKLALSFVVEYAGDASKPRHTLTLQNDLSSCRPHNFEADQMLEDCRIAVRDITRKFALHFDISLAELQHPIPRKGETQAKRFVMGKGRAQVYIDTFFRFNRTLIVPAPML